MKRLRPLSVALIASVAVAWSLPTFATGNCANGKTLYNKTNAQNLIACSNSNCHGSTVNKNNIQNASNNPGLIDQALDGPPGDPAMSGIRSALGLTASDLDDIALWIFYAPSCPATGPVLQAAPSPVAFAATTVGATSATTTVTISNSGTGPASAVTASSGDTTHFPISANTCNNVTVNAGASCSFAVAFHPTLAGSASGTITVNRTGGTLSVGVSGTGTATATPGQLSMSTSIGFGSQLVATTSSATSVTITNIGGTAVAVSSVASNNPSEFAIASNSCSTVNPGASCAVGVTFRPTVAGTRSATITVASNGLGSPQSIGASGTGTSPVGTGTLSMSSSVNFGNQTVGSTSAATSVTVTNIGTAAVSVSGVSSNNPSEFAITGSNCATVNASASCSFSLTFKPGATGVRSAWVTVTSNGTGSPQAVSVTGNGTAVAASPTVAVVEFYNAVFDHYFITSSAAEVALLNAHQPPFQDWAPTGLSFNGYVNATAPASSVAICRFFNSTFAPKSSHFYAPHGLGCEATLASFPDWKMEDDKLFNSMLPDASGACPGGTVPVYRLYNNGMGGAPNHRFVISLAERQKMMTKGFVPEGNGIGVGMCVPP